MLPTAPGFSVAAKLGWARSVLSEVLTTFTQKGGLLDQSQLNIFKDAHKEYATTQRRLEDTLGLWSFRDPELRDHVAKCKRLRGDIEAALEEAIKASVQGKVPAGDMNDNTQVVMDSPPIVNTETPKSSASDAPIINPSRPSHSKISSISSVSSSDPPSPPPPTVKPRERPAPSLSGLDTKQINEVNRPLRATGGPKPNLKYLSQRPPRWRPSVLPESSTQSGCQIISGYADCPTMNTGSGYGNSGATKQYFFGRAPAYPPSEA